MYNRYKIYLGISTQFIINARVDPVIDSRAALRALYSDQSQQGWIQDFGKGGGGEGGGVWVTVKY